jgi:glycosyltransferase involved in cell wall biosynthesis
MATPFYTEPMKWLEKRAASNATAIITDSIASAEDIERFLKFPPEATDVVYLAGTPPETRPARVERERDLFLAVGNRLPHKNFAGLVRAIGRIPKEQRPHLVVTGSRGDDPLRAIVDELDLSDSVDLKSWVSDEELDWLYAHTTALMVANFCDGFGLPIIEAQLMGTPVLLSDIPVYHEVAGEGAGFFDTTDPDAIAAAMLHAVANPEWLATLVDKGFVNAAPFTWRRTAKQTLAVLERSLRHPERAKRAARSKR